MERPENKQGGYEQRIMKIIIECCRWQASNIY